ncbi:hypothetical protein N7495_002285 [Penicillium taxi]|uniref:uncharacterized protein n=1 Tax=Penicillium taxi TaxID=168475 RepID=UPI00254520FF|nr:uncharacterized protein N7495_002285 [Penicillium taxi]KAJ5901757.1 hypothetical protein N7495_002285 [Penicillium taxi]
MSSTPPPFNLPTWKVIVGLSLSFTFLMLIEKLFSLNHKKPKKEEDHPLIHYPGFSPVLGTGETQTTLLRAWVEIHGHVAKAQAANQAATQAARVLEQSIEKTPYEKVYEKIGITRGGQHNTHHGNLHSVH